MESFTEIVRDTMADYYIETHLSAAPAEMFLRLLLATVMGAVIGWERETQNKAAGLRTHMMVALGAATFTLATLQLFLVLEGQPSAQSDPVRIVEGIVGGIGFLGAGQIIQARGAVHGVTTAAGIWVVGGVGVASGMGHYALALMTVSLAFAILTLARFLESDMQDEEAAP
jgi:putative Mg2+ transporter-C (MgtC) family protein